VHIALFLDLAWLYMLAMIRTTEHIRGGYLGDPDRGIQEYIFGGATGLREKQETAQLLVSVAPPEVGALDHLPPYYRNLRELATRLMRRPGRMQPALRYLEAAAALAAARNPRPLLGLFGDQDYDLIAGKLAADVCGFLVAAADLDPNFRIRARSFLLAESAPNSGAAAAPAEVAQPHDTPPGGSPAADARPAGGLEAEREPTPGPVPALPATDARQPSLPTLEELAEGQRDPT